MYNFTLFFMFIVSKCLKVETTPLCVGVGLEPLCKVVSCENDFKNKRAFRLCSIICVYVSAILKFALLLAYPIKSSFLGNHDMSNINFFIFFCFTRLFILLYSFSVVSGYLINVRSSSMIFYYLMKSQLRDLTGY